MKRKILFIMIFLTMLGAVLIVYLNRIFFPIKFKQIVIEKTQEYLDRRVNIGELHFSPTKGFVIEQLDIFKKKSQEPFFHADRAYFKIVYTSIFQDKRIFVPSVTVENPSLAVTRSEDNIWDFTDMIPSRRKAKTENEPLSVWIGGVSVINGTFKLTDRSQSEPFFEIIDRINLKTNLSFRKAVHFKLDCVLPRHAASIASQGQYDLTERRLETDLRSANLPIEQYWQLYLRKPDFPALKGKIKSANLRLIHEDGSFHLTGDVQIEQPEIISGDTLRLKAAALDMSKGRLLFSTRDWNMTGILNIIQTDMNFETQKRFRGDIHSSNLTFIRHEGTININGDIQTEKVRAEFSPQGQLTGQIAMTDAHLVMNAGETIFESRLAFKNTKLIVPGNKVFAGNATANLELRQDRNLQKLTYRGWAELNDGTMDGLPPMIGKTNKINGKIDFVTDGLKTKNLSFTAQGMPIFLSGNLTNFARPILDIEASSQAVPLEKLPSIFPDFFKTVNLTPSGSASIFLKYKGKPSDPAASPKIDVNAKLKEAMIVSDKIPSPVTGISGELRYTTNLITWESFKGTYRGKLYTLNGQLVDFTRPSVETAVVSQDLELKTKIFILRTALDIATLKGRYLGTPFELTGDIGTSSWIDPEFDLQGSVGLKLEDLFLVMPEIKIKLQNINPAGTVNIKGSFKGRLKDWRNWNIALTGESPGLTLAGYQLKKLLINFAQDKGIVNRLDISGDFYGGALLALSNADLTQKAMPYQTTIEIKDADLAKLKTDSAWKDQDLSGLLTASASIKGEFNDQTRLRGQGSVFVQNGRLWQLNLLTGLGKLLFIPEFKNIVFEEGLADFLITDKRISTDNLVLKSKPVNFLGGGWIDYTGNLNFHIRSRFSEKTIAESTSLKKMMTAIIMQTDNYLTIRVYNTLKDPKFVVVPANVNIIEKATDTIMDGLQTIFEELP